MRAPASRQQWKGSPLHRFSIVGHAARLKRSSNEVRGGLAKSKELFFAGNVCEQETLHFIPITAEAVSSKKRLVAKKHRDRRHTYVIGAPSIQSVFVAIGFQNRRRSSRGPNHPEIAFHCIRDEGRTLCVNEHTSAAAIVVSKR